MLGENSSLFKYPNSLVKAVKTFIPFLSDKLCSNI